MDFRIFAIDIVSPPLTHTKNTISYTSCFCVSFFNNLTVSFHAFVKLFDVFSSFSVVYYDVEVHTGDVHSAECERADVSVNIFGERGDTGERCLVNPKRDRDSMFRRNQVFITRVKVPDSCPDFKGRATSGFKPKFHSRAESL